MICPTEDGFNFTSVTQTDFKMMLPQSFINLTLPTKMNEWYNTFIEVVNKMKI